MHRFIAGTAVSSSQEGGGVQINLGIIALVAVAVLAAVLLLRRRRR